MENDTMPNDPISLAWNQLQAQTFGPRMLASKMLKIMNSVHAGAKDGKNAAQNYQYHSEAKLTAIIRAALIEHGVMAYISIDRTELTQIVKEDHNNSKISFLTEVWGSIEFVCTETGYSKTKGIYGQGYDSTDKGGNKGNTGAHKYALLRSFFLSDAESEPDASGADNGGRSAEKATETKTRGKASTKPVNDSDAANGTTKGATDKNSTDATKGTKNGQQYSRELLTPERIKVGMQEQATKEPEVATEQLQQQTVIALSKLFNGNEEKRRALTKYIFGVESSKDLTKGGCLVLLRWIGLKSEHVGKEIHYVPSAEAVAEAEQILKLVLIKG